MAKASGNTRMANSSTAAATRTLSNAINSQNSQVWANAAANDVSEQKTHYQNVTQIDRSKFSTFVKTLPTHIKDMINVDINKAITGTSRKLGGYINVDFGKLTPYQGRQVESYLTKLGYSIEDNGATVKAISYKWRYKGK